MRTRLALSITLASVALACHADVLDFSSGVDASGNRLAGGSIDPRWTVDVDGGPGATAYVGSPLPSGYVYDPNAQWLTRATTGLSNDPGGVYEFRTFFSLAGYDPSTAVLNIRYSGDDEVRSISFNEATYLPTNYGYGTLSPTFTIASGFHEENTLVLRVNNVGSGPPYGPGHAINPVGGLMDVFVTATPLPTPEPGTWAALGLGAVVVEAAQAGLKDGTLLPMSVPIRRLALGIEECRGDEEPLPVLRVDRGKDELPSRAYFMAAIKEVYRAIEPPSLP